MKTLYLDSSFSKIQYAYFDDQDGQPVNWGYNFESERGKQAEYSLSLLNDLLARITKARQAAGLKAAKTHIDAWLMQHGVKEGQELTPQQLAQAQLVADQFQVPFPMTPVGIQDLEHIVINRGPGTFIGTRIAASIVQGLAATCPKAKFYSLNSFELMLCQMQNLSAEWFKIIPEALFENFDWQVNPENDPDDKVRAIVAFDANMGQSYVQVYQLDFSKEVLGFGRVKKEIEIVDTEVFEPLANWPALDFTARTQLLLDHPELVELGIRPDKALLLVGNGFGELEKFHETMRWDRWLYARALQGDNFWKWDRMLYCLRAQALETKEDFSERLEEDGGKQEYVDTVIAQACLELASCPHLLTLEADSVKYAQPLDRYNFEPEYVRNDVTY